MTVLALVFPLLGVEIRIENAYKATPRLVCCLFLSHPRFPQGHTKCREKIAGRNRHNTDESEARGQPISKDPMPYSSAGG